MFRRIVLLIALLVCTCCVRTPLVADVTVAPTQKVLPVYISENFTTLDASDVFEGVRDWNEAMRGYVYLVVVSTTATRSPDILADIRERRGLFIDQVLSTCGCLPLQFPLAEAWFDGGTNAYLVRDRMTSGDVKQVAMHEIGHFLGAPDRKSPGLMYFATDDAIQWGCVDRETALDVADHQGLLVSQMRFCTEHP